MAAVMAAQNHWHLLVAGKLVNLATVRMYTIYFVFNEKVTLQLGPSSYQAGCPGFKS